MPTSIHNTTDLGNMHQHNIYASTYYNPLPHLMLEQDFFLSKNVCHHFMEYKMRNQYAEFSRFKRYQALQTDYDYHPYRVIIINGTQRLSMITGDHLYF